MRLEQIKIAVDLIGRRRADMGHSVNTLNNLDTKLEEITKHARMIGKFSFPA